MQVTIDVNRCEGHGTCAISAPSVFSLDDDGLARNAYEGQDIPDAVESMALFAVTTCPVAALRRA